MELSSTHSQNVIVRVEAGSIAQEIGIAPGDLLLSIDGQSVEDIIEYQYLLAEEEVEVLILHQNGEQVLYEIEKEIDEDLGIEFRNPIIDEVRACSNHCLFCFVDQLPTGMRETLYFKDDDSRLSFLQGNFITMTNMTNEDIERMIQYRISPVNISVHATDDEVRTRLLGTKKARGILAKMRRLCQAGLSMNGQIVLVPGFNDQDVLERTLDDLASLYPHMESVAVVPVGLSRHRKNLAKLQGFDVQSAGQVIDQIDAWQRQNQERLGTRFVFASDEFYVLAKRALPEADYYEGYGQSENGVGLLRLFIEHTQADLARLTTCDAKGRVLIPTGRSAFSTIQEAALQIMRRCPKLSIEVIPVTNTFFGESITVSGLLTAQDVLQALPPAQPGERIVLSRAMMRQGEEVFLDDMTLVEFAEQARRPVCLAQDRGEDFVSCVLA